MFSLFAFFFLCLPILWLPQFFSFNRTRIVDLIANNKSNIKNTKSTSLSGKDFSANELEIGLSIGTGENIFYIGTVIQINLEKRLSL